MTEENLRSMVAREYIALADLLADLSEPSWDTASLCEGWRIREVVAHMTMAARYSPEQFYAELRDCDNDFGRLSDTIAARDAALPTSTLVADLRSDTMQQWTPPGGEIHGALNHVVVHGLDITIALGLPRRAPDATIRTVLDDLTEGGIGARFGTDLGEHTLTATDLDWTYGTGSALRGEAADLVAHLCGRSLPAGRLQRD
jgi:uncharacterized protein (TIGR03083 family)